jgi:phospholipase C
MGFFAPPQIPITDFLAQNYMICDRWFAPLPASTQPNRLVALSGYSQIDVTRSDLLPDQTLVFDWLSRHDVRWRVYHSGISFLLLFQSMWANAVSDRFRRFNALAADLQNEPDATFPQVIFIEPAYHDSPVLDSNRMCR